MIKLFWPHLKRVTIFMTLWTLASIVLASPAQASWWEFQSIDTMKYSRDRSREYLDSPDFAFELIDQQVSDIAATGVTHVSIATPYDEEFLPVLQMWVAAARRYDLNIWFRGNFSGWEEWFGYREISRSEHLEMTEAFLQKNIMLFEDGDVFSACPECENGGPGDPRLNGDLDGHRQFLIDEYKVTSKIFRDAGLNVRSNFNSMNGDVAMLVMNRTTTQALGGLVVVDHYVESPEQLNEDISAFAERSGAQVILGEFGAPIPDIHNSLTPEEQAEWVDQALFLLAKNKNLEGINYWTNIGGSTSLWRESGEAKPVVEVVSKYFSATSWEGRVVDELHRPIAGVEITSKEDTVTTNAEGKFSIRSLNTEEVFGFSKPGYESKLETYATITRTQKFMIIPENPSRWYKFRLWFQETFFNL